MSRIGPVALCLVGLVFIGLGAGAGSLSLGGVEPAGASFVSCGPALFGRPDPWPDPACGWEYSKLSVVTFALLAVGAVWIACGVWVGLHHRKGSSAPAACRSAAG